MSKIQKRIYLLRHGQSVDNTMPVYQSIHSPLSAKGKIQAKEIAKKLSKIDFDLLISSPYERAMQTAIKISEATGKEIEYSKLFTERKKPSSTEGKPYEDVEAKKKWQKWDSIAYTPGMKFEDGENYDDLLKRVRDALLFLINKNEQSIVVVTHGYFTRTIIARILTGEYLNGDILKNFQHHANTENTAVTIIERYEDAKDEYDWHLVTYNDHSHFE